MELKKTVTAAFKELSTGFLIDSAAFAKLAPVEQTQVLLANSGKQVVFTASFSGLRNRKTLRDGLIAGKDMTTELEFNNIELTDEDRKVLTQIGGLFAKIDAANLSNYPWGPEASDALKSAISIGKGVCITRRGQRAGKASLRKIWYKASLFWAGGKKPASYYLDIGGHYHRQIIFFEDRVEIGCQTIRRDEFEYVARELGWEPAEA